MKTLLLFLITALLSSAQLQAQILDNIWELTELNDPNETDSYPWISDDGLRLYFTSDDGFGNNLFYSSRPDLNTDFEPRQLVDSALFSESFSFWFTDDELNVYYSANSLNVGLLHSTRTSTTSAFGASTEINLVGGNVPFLGGPSFTPGGEELYFYNSLGLVKYEYTNDSTYTYVSDISPPTGYDGGVAQLSKNGLELYWAIDPVGTDSSYIYKYDRTAIGDDFLNSVLLNAQINAPVLINNQPSYATAANVLVWVRNDEFSWDGNQLFLAQSSIASVDELSPEPKELVKIVDLLGRETSYVPGVVLIYVYSDGSTVKRFTMKE